MDKINKATVPDRFGPTQANPGVLELFHNSCRELVDGSKYYWRKDGHHVNVMLVDHGVELKMACPGDRDPDLQPYACMYDHGDLEERCWVRHWIEAQAWVQDFLRMGLICVTVQGAVPVVWSRTGASDDPNLDVAPLAAIVYACNVTAEEFGPGIVDVDWWDGPTENEA